MLSQYLEASYALRLLETHPSGVGYLLKERVFDATLAMSARPLDSAAMNRLLLGYPLMTMKVAAAIYWEALKLFARRLPVHPHPRHRLTRS